MELKLVGGWHPAAAADVLIVPFMELKPDVLVVVLVVVLVLIVPFMELKVPTCMR